MSAKEFVAINWTPNQIIDEASMDQMNDNMVHVRNRSVNGKYMHMNNGLVEQGIKILCGRRQITPRKSDTAVVRVGFASIFTPNSEPVITTSITSPSASQFFLKISGVNRLHPNHQGFEATVRTHADSKKADIFARSIFINWIAMGY